MRGGTSTLMMAVGLIVGVVLAVTGLVTLLARSDSDSEPVEGLRQVTGIVQVSTADLTADRWFPSEEDPTSPFAELDVLEVRLDRAEIVDLYPGLDGAPHPGESPLFSIARDPTGRLPMTSYLDAEQLVILVWPRTIYYTAERSVSYQGRIIALDQTGHLLQADWEGEASTTLSRLFEWGSEHSLTGAETMAASVRTLKGRADPFEDQIRSIIGS